jgi:hypothetical protein
MKIGKPQDFLSAVAKVDGTQLRIIFARGKNRPNQLTNPGAVEIRHVAQIQQDTLSAVAEKIYQQFVNRLALNQRKSAADVHDRNVSHLPGTGAKTQMHSPLAL